MRVTLNFGTERLAVDIPENRLLAILEPTPLAEVASESDLIKEALDSPLGSAPLRDLARPGDKIAIVVSDLTRPCPTQRLLPPLLGELTLAGVHDKHIIIVFALGSHRKHSAVEQKSLVGLDIFERIRCVDSDANNHFYLGTTSRGTPVELFAPVAEADLIVCVGNIELHRFAGYTGGVKAIMPGVSSRDSITRNHALLLQPGAVAGKAAGNPVREDIEEAGQIAGIGFIFNVVLDGTRRIIEAVAGDARLAHRRGCERVDSLYRPTIAREADIVLVSPGGYPKDISLFQAQKALDFAMHAVKEEGVIILVAECREGIGDMHFEAWMREAVNADEVIERLRDEFVLGGNKAFSIALASKKAQIYLVSSLPSQLLSDCWKMPGLDHFSSIDRALQSAMAELGPDVEIAVIPQGNSTLPVVEGG